MGTLLLVKQNDYNQVLTQSTGLEDADKVVLGITSSVYRIIFRVGIYGIVVALVFCGISFLLSGDDARNRAESKNWLFRIGIVLIVFASITAIFGAVGNFLTKVL